jgi:dihydroxyacetone kinase
MKRFTNAKANIVTEAIDGFLATTANDKLARLDGYPHTKVIVRTDWDKARVALVSGGGSGHEPAHVGFVGEGMLTAAVCGEIFASPTVDAVLSAILAVTGEAGCLLIVKNYTGDRLNFGLAAERAKAMGLKVEMVIVGDDIAIPGALQPRGVAGTLFVHKVAGHAAAQGQSLAQVTKAAQTTADESFSIGLSLDTCTVPGSIKEDYLKEGEVELGLGIHGEPGVSRIAFASANRLMGMASSRLEKAIGASRSRYALLINNLGAVPPLEMTILAHAFGKTKLSDLVDVVIGPGHLMTSLDMNGFSLSLVPLTRTRRKALLSEVGVPSWPGVRVNGKVRTIKLPKTGGRKHKASSDPAARAVIQAVCKSLASAEDDLNRLDARTGDGDTGTTFGSAARVILRNANRLPCADGAKLAEALSDTLAQHMGGASGVLMAILFAAAGKAYAQRPDWASAMMEGASQVMQYGGAQRGDRTMLDALLPGLEALLNGKSIEGAAKAARKGAKATARIKKAGAGRSTYVGGDRLVGVVDPGAEAVARAFEAVGSE